MDYKVFQENVLFHYRNPMNKGKLEKPTFSAIDSNPLCGDEVEVQVRVKSGRVEDARFSGSGCAISQASASMLTESVKGKSVEELKRLSKGDIFKLIGIELSPARMRCALLPLRALKVGLYAHLKEPEQLRRAKRELS